MDGPIFLQSPDGVLAFEYVPKIAEHLQWKRGLFCGFRPAGEHPRALPAGSHGHIHTPFSTSSLPIPDMTCHCGWRGISKNVDTMHPQHRQKVFRLSRDLCHGMPLTGAGQRNVMLKQLGCCPDRRLRVHVLLGALLRRVRSSTSLPCWQHDHVHACLRKLAVRVLAKFPAARVRWQLCEAPLRLMKVSFPRA